jgi:hypothetical protein
LGVADTTGFGKIVMGTFAESIHPLSEVAINFKLLIPEVLKLVVVLQLSIRVPLGRTHVFEIIV